MKRKHAATLTQIFTRPVPGGIRWADIEALFIALGAEINEREGSRVSVFLFGEVKSSIAPTLRQPLTRLLPASGAGWKNTE